MPAISASAPGKVILFGEHAVVYGYPAIAVPVTQVYATALVTPNIRGESGSIFLDAPDIELQGHLADLPLENPLAKAIQLTLQALGTDRPPAMNIRLTSTIPIASGLGSGAAASVALIRGISTFLGKPLPPDKVNELAFEVEKIYHGTPSGIDNTAITYRQPVYFRRGKPVETLRVALPLTLVIGDSGIPSFTAQVVGEVRAAWEKDPKYYEALFEGIGAITDQARQAIESGRSAELGPWMNENQSLLEKMGVSSPELEELLAAARAAGAQGAKLSGGGRGGNIIALATTDTAQEIARALKATGAKRVIISEVMPNRGS